MFLSQDQIKRSVENIVSIHPFFGISFLVAKEARLPIDRTISLPINNLEDDFLKKYYQPQKDSTYLYRAFRVSDKRKFWLRSDYAPKGSQRNRTGTFGDAFLHPKGTDEWGWQETYVSFLESKLVKETKIPAYYLSVWLYREDDWSLNTEPEDIISRFQRQFKFTDSERDKLLDFSIPDFAFSSGLLSEFIFSWPELSEELEIPPPPDAPQDEGGTLSFLTLNGVGPAQSLHLEFSERTNLLTGDNGLGKSFVLESVWWALSGHWTGFQVFPREDASREEPEISFQISGASGAKNKASSQYDWESQAWQLPSERPTIPGLLIYAKADGAFAVWDPARDYWGLPQSTNDVISSPLVFGREDIWNGLSITTGGRTAYLSKRLFIK